MSITIQKRSASRVQVDFFRHLLRIFCSHAKVHSIRLRMADTFVRHSDIHDILTFRCFLFFIC